MQGQKQIVTFFVILIVVCSFTFFRNAIRKDKQLKRLHEETLRKKLESNSNYNEEKPETVTETNYVGQRKDTENYLYKFLEYENICFDIHAIIFKPEKDMHSTYLTRIETQQKHLDDTIPIQYLDPKQKKSVVTGPLIYLLIIILVYSFIKAATDMSKQLTRQSEGGDTGIRRCSLQGYANSKRHRRSSRGPLLKRATTLQCEPRLPAKQLSMDDRRRSHINADFITGSGMVTEPGTPPKIPNGLASRPPVLIRRCSVPAFLHQPTAHGSLLRRPSIDSFSEDDSSPDMKRRVRMIHRH